MITKFKIYENWELDKLSKLFIDEIEIFFNHINKSSKWATPPSQYIGLVLGDGYDGQDALYLSLEVCEYTIRMYFNFFKNDTKIFDFLKMVLSTYLDILEDDEDDVLFTNTFTRENIENLNLIKKWEIYKESDKYNL